MRLKLSKVNGEMRKRAKVILKTIEENQPIHIAELQRKVYPIASYSALLSYLKLLSDKLEFKMVGRNKCVSLKK